jgi:hypothetical protein
MNSVHDVVPGESNRLRLTKRVGNRTKSADGNSNFSSSQRKNNFRENISAWWLLHTISDVFQGSDAYKQASQHVWSEIEIVENGNDLNVRIAKENDFLLYQPELVNYSTALKSLFIKEFRVTQAPMTRIPSQSALAVFHAAYKYKNLDMVNFDMDHAVAYRAQRNATQARLDKPIPLNHVANWLPLKPNLNRSRQNTPWSQFYLTLTASDQNEVGNDLLIKSESLTPELLNSVDKFGSVMLIRFANMVNAALTNVGLNEYLEKNSSERIHYLSALAKDIALSLNIGFDEESFKSNLLVD